VEIKESSALEFSTLLLTRDHRNIILTHSFSLKATRNISTMDGRDILCGQQLLIFQQPALNDVEINRKTLDKPRKIVAGRLKEANWTQP